MQANERKPFGTPLAIQCLGLRVSTAGSWEGGGGGRSLITGQGTKIPLALLCGQKKKKKKERKPMYKSSAATLYHFYFV